MLAPCSASRSSRRAARGLLWVAALGWALTGPEVLAGEGTSLEALRATRARAVGVHATLQREQAALEPALAAVGAAISARKAVGAVSADGALESLLQRHRELSERLTELSREQRASGAALLQATQGLIDGVDREISRLRRVAKARSGAARSARAALRSLLAERARFAVGPVGGGCALPEVELSPADGPEEAEAKLNLLRDAEERCRRRIRRVESRLSELQDERRLLQEAADFRDEGELFDEESRRRTQVRAQLPTAPERSAVTPAAGATASASPGAAGGTSTGGAASDAAESPTAAPPVLLRQAQVDSTLTGAHRDSPDEELASLRAQRRELERAAGRIRAAHEALRKRAGHFGR